MTVTAVSQCLNTHALFSRVFLDPAGKSEEERELVSQLKRSPSVHTHGWIEFQATTGSSYSIRRIALVAQTCMPDWH
jgi:hypothetical protein